MSWAGPEEIYLSTSLASYLDKKLLVLLRDGRKLMGLLRSFDQFANAVLEGACERVIVGDLYCDIHLGLYVIRGENVVLIGELDLEREELPPLMARVSEAEIRRNEWCKTKSQPYTSSQQSTWKAIWKNPSGFYGFMSLAFAILGLFWFFQYARFWREIFPLQNCITLVITLGMFEMAFWYFDYAEFIETGIRPTGITKWAVTFGTIKHTVARLVILMVSMGYGVVRPTLGGLTSKVILVGVTFFVASEVLEMVENVGTVSDLSGRARLFSVLAVSMLDAFIIIWMFKSLSATLNKLQAKRMMVKPDIYRKFTNALAVVVIVSVGWICYELYFKANDVYNECWQNAWIIPAFWRVLSFSLLCVICALWAPSLNSMRYTYSDDASDEFDRDDGALTLIKPSTIPSKDVQSSLEPRPVQANNGASNGDSVMQNSVMML
ncbi:hypothetical protein SADUNF_Sadunf01G0130900 [Salix dunnii]|uniref:Sm domain-containing protein n=1 Tax=Salix dunnii TaxID=1413687 RepID=A0A835TKG5_9ROSI|nr:hypothetical protein SADUNF_Sadunf01G0130900 [Salix dunnii]